MAFPFLKNKKNSQDVITVISDSEPYGIIKSECLTGKLSSLTVDVNGVDYTIAVDRDKHIFSALKWGDDEAFSSYLYWLPTDVQEAFTEAGFSKLTLESFVELYSERDTKQKLADEAWMYISRVTVSNLIELRKALAESNGGFATHLEYRIAPLTVDIPSGLAYSEEELNALIDSDIKETEKLTEEYGFSDDTVLDNLLLNEESLDSDASPVLKFVVSGILRNAPISTIRSFSTGFFWSNVLDEIRSLIESGAVTIPPDDTEAEEEEHDTELRKTPEDLMDDDSQLSYDTDIFSGSGGNVESIDFSAMPDEHELVEMSTSVDIPENAVVEDEAPAVEQPPVEPEPLPVETTLPVVEPSPAPAEHLVPLDETHVNEVATLCAVVRFSVSADGATGPEAEAVEPLLVDCVRNEKKIAELTQLIDSKAEVFQSIDNKNLTEFFAHEDGFTADEKSRKLSETAFYETAELEKEREDVIALQIETLQKVAALKEMYKTVAVTESAVLKRIDELVGVRNVAFDSQREAERDGKDTYSEALEALEDIDVKQDECVEPIPPVAENTPKADALIFSELAAKYGLSL